jgi:hypothetical protein
VPDVRLETVDAQDHLPLRHQDLLEPAVIAEDDGEEFVVPVEEVGDGPLGHPHPAADEVGADLRDGPVLGVPEAADQGDDVQPELVPGQRDGPLGLRPVRPLVGRTGGGVAPADGQVQPGHAGQGVDRPAVRVIGPHRPTAVRAGGPLRGQVAGDTRFRRLRRLRHGTPSGCAPKPNPATTSMPVTIAGLEKN